MIKPEDIEVPEWLMESRCGRELMTWREIYAEILAALPNNPIAPTDEEVEEMLNVWTLTGHEQSSRVFLCTEWQRRMFLRKRNPELVAKAAPDMYAAICDFLEGYCKENSEDFRGRLSDLAFKFRMAKNKAEGK